MLKVFLNSFSPALSETNKGYAKYNKEFKNVTYFAFLYFLSSRYPWTKPANLKIPTFETT